MTGSQSLQTLLRRHRGIALDTNIFIYELEENPKYLPLTVQIFQWVATANHVAITSTLTMTELLTRPYAQKSAAWVNQYYGLLSQYPNLEWVAPDLEIAVLAARYRAQYRMRTPDAIQAATAVKSGVRGFISNDAVFKRVEDLETLVLDELV